MWLLGELISPCQKLVNLADKRGDCHLHVAASVTERSKKDGTSFTKVAGTGCTKDVC
jgi:hypothetical protein